MSGLFSMPETPIRFVDGINHIQGTLQTKINHTWYQVCSDGFEENDAIVICRMSGHYHARNATFSTKESNDSSILGNWKCNGDEVDVSECAYYSESVGTCSSRKIIEVDCRALVRIVDGPSPTKGRVEVFYGGHWGPICRGSVSSNEAHVICRSAGYRYTYAIILSAYNNLQEPNTNGTIKNVNTYTNKTFDNHTITNLVCTGYEDELTECIGPFTPIRLSGSSNSTGAVEAFYDGSWRTFCKSYFGYKEAAVICRRLNFKVGEPLSYYGSGFINTLRCTGIESDITECGNPYLWGSSTCSSGSNRRAGVQCSTMPACIVDNRVRLQSGINRYQGRVEFQYYGVWGTVCHKHFDKYEAQVICRLAHVPGNQ
ncbi:SRCR1-like protein [Mya arenaria]|uniref:SRCR1-like protein n=1 Tax=Mya arenaria TaxID=6604 RepID=A0ABY7DGA5_MYAAR|nr:SRCR1-like protein [Mya arenaria]